MCLRHLRVHRSASLAPATRAPGPHAFAVRQSCRPSGEHISVHRIPPHDRDDAFAPLHRGGTRCVRTYNYEYRKLIIFARGAGQIRFSSDLRKVICPTGCVRRKCEPSKRCTNKAHAGFRALEPRPTAAVVPAHPDWTLGCGESPGALGVVCPPRQGHFLATIPALSGCL